MTKVHSKKSLILWVIEIGVAILVALAIATVVRQMWFELYEIPTGSMRPSFREQDRLTVSKTAFGLNIPLQTKHLYFDRELVQRGGVLIFSGDKIPLLDQQTTYFGVIPYTKRYIKRLIGKPGDSLYFYGGKVYGVDKDGKPLNELLEDPWMGKLEHIPFISFEGEMSGSSGNKILFKHMGIPIGRIAFTGLGTHQGEIHDGGVWKKDDPFSKNPNQEISTFGDYWGIGNFAMARLLTREELKTYTNFDPDKLDKGVLYLQLKHSPNLAYPPPRLYRQGTEIGAQVPTFESIIPLTQEHLDLIRDHMYTTRFVIKNGRAHRYNANDRRSAAGGPSFIDVPDGTYEYFNGNAERVGFQGWSSTLPENHPLNERSIERTQELYNRGIEMLAGIDRDTFYQYYYPHRYVYFRDGDLYILGAPVLKKEDPRLKAFVESEKDKEKQSTSRNPYLAFVDKGPPLKDGNFDVSYIQKFGVRIPENYYLALGDNHAMSADSRLFGFLSQENIQGAPSLLLWPPGERWGWPPQSPYPFITIPRLIVWAIVAAIFTVWYVIHRRKAAKKPFTNQHD